MLNIDKYNKLKEDVLKEIESLSIYKKVYKCRELDNDNYYLVQNSQELKSFINDYEVLKLINELYYSIEGIILEIYEGEIIELYITHDIAYYNLNADYYKIDIFN